MRLTVLIAAFVFINYIPAVRGQETSQPNTSAGKKAMVYLLTTEPAKDAR